MSSVYEFLKPSLPTDHYRQTNSRQMVEAYYATSPQPSRILDLGCGAGATIDYFRKLFPRAQWTGVDIESSPEVDARTRTDGAFHTYDGVTLPFEKERFDLIYSNQVLEHVRYPERVLGEVARTLTASGVFIGQTSQLEPYHSFSLFNFTVYGFKTLCEAAGLKLSSVRPSIDGITLIERSLRGRPPEYARWFSEESPHNIDIQDAAKKAGVSIAVTNYRKLVYCGQFSFICARI